MADAVEIRITATNGASAVFRAIGQDADRLGQSLTTSGREGDRAFDQIEKGAREAGREIDRAEKQARTFGDRMDSAARGLDSFAAGLTAIGAGLVFSGNLAMQQERQVIALQNAYGDAADEMLAFAEELDAVTIFSDDDIREGERFFATLRNNYNLTIEEIQRLMQITADLASSANISFADASNRVAAAIRGEAEAAEYLGLTLNQQAIDRENLTLSMTNEEAARFRLNHLYQQAAVYEGTAADLAASSVGTYADLTDAVQDAAAAFGGFLGPMGSVLGGIGTMSLGLTGMVGGFRMLAPALRSAAVASAAFVASPLGLAITAVAGAVTLATIAFGRHGDDIDEAKQSYEELQDAVKTTDDTIRNLNLQGDFGLATRLRRDIDDARSAMDEYQRSLEEVFSFGDVQNTAAEEWDQFFNTGLGQRILSFAQGEGWLDSAAASMEVSTQTLVTAIMRGDLEAIEAAKPFLRDAAAQYYAEFEMTDEDRAAIEGSMQPLFDLYANPNINVDRLDTEVTKLFDAFEAGTLSTEDLIGALTWLFQDITAGADVFDILNTAVQGLTASQREFQHMLDDLRLEGETELADTLETLNGLFLDLSDTQLVNADTAKVYADSQERINEAIANGSVDGDAMLTYLRGQQTLLDQGIISYEEYAQSVIWAADNLPVFAAANGEASEAVRELGEAMSEGGDIVVEALEEMHKAALEAYEGMGSAATEAVDATIAANEALAESLDTAWDAGAEGVTAYGDALRDLQGRMMAFGGFDTPVAMVDMLGLGETTEQMAELETHAERTMASIVHGAIDARASITDIAEQTLIVQSALDNTFRIMISNVEAMAQSAQGTFDFLDELFALNDEGFSQADVLLNQGRLSWDQYTAAANAYNNVANDNYAIQQDLLAIQAQQAPVLATLVAQQQDYIERLREMPAEQQALALGWMDATTAAQAYEAVALAGAVANGELGSSGEQMFQQMITGAVAANPILGQILEDMDLISIGADGTIKVHLEGFEGADSAIIDLTNSIDALTLALGGIPPVRIDAETEEAAAAIAAVEEQLVALNGQRAGVTVEGDSTPAESAMMRARDALLALDGDSATVHAEGENSGALSAVRGASTALAALDGNTATVHINAINNAGAAIGAVASQLASLDGRTATAYVRTVNLGVVGGGVGSLFAQGGTVWPETSPWGIAPQAANGRTVIVGEHGAELVTLPHGAQVMPHAASMSRMEAGGGGIVIDFSGATFNNTSRTEMRQWAEEDLAPSLMKALDDRDHAYGGWR